MLRTFVSEAPDKKSNLQKFFDADDTENYRIAVHALKSGSRTIGAMQLSEQARALEEAAKSGDTEYIKSNHDLLNVTFDGTTELIASVLPNVQARAASGETEEGDWDRLIEELKEAIDGFDSDAAAEIMDKAGSITHNGTVCSEILSKVFSALRDYDFIAAGEALEEIGG